MEETDNEWAAGFLGCSIYQNTGHCFGDVEKMMPFGPVFWKFPDDTMIRKGSWQPDTDLHQFKLVVTEFISKCDEFQALAMKHWCKALFDTPAALKAIRDAVEGQG